MSSGFSGTGMSEAKTEDANNDVIANVKSNFFTFSPSLGCEVRTQKRNRYSLEMKMIIPNNSTWSMSGNFSL